ncbi:formyltransferase family protein [Desulfoscipio gibsoniae]|uniref:phosphoribosylglycinamide formyltransferase 1 n=1 Tax=Desulfoscipio gibsoniae DSM 7213 TaxID=767817 RepID=R4KWF2_9FIRM|nr:formyltransferase family protein [Desulfoscipio gibsoniae]AGL03956.1 methionyl-tRNA formyltransferase [Desulfoscipio gibsoniae DSM 7213]
MIGVFTYNIAHRKTYDTLCLLKTKGYHDVAVFAEPLHYAKKYTPLIEHRPKNFNDVLPSEICKNFGYEYHMQNTSVKDILPVNSKILICGAGLIPQSIVEQYRVINAHPGYIPYVRGLDALKWAIYDEQPIGVTTHQIGSEVDAGLIIERRIVPVYFNDTFHAVAQRQYDMEISMLVDAIAKIDVATEYVEPGNYKLHKRMPHEFETRLLSKFEKLKDKAVIKCNSEI